MFGHSKLWQSLEKGFSAGGIFLLECDKRRVATVYQGMSGSKEVQILQFRQENNGVPVERSVQRLYS